MIILFAGCVCLRSMAAGWGGWGGWVGWVGWGGWGRSFARDWSLRSASLKQREEAEALHIQHNLASICIPCGERKLDDSGRNLVGS